MTRSQLSQPHATPQDARPPRSTRSSRAERRPYRGPLWLWPLTWLLSLGLIFAGFVDVLVRDAAIDPFPPFAEPTPDPLNTLDRLDPRSRALTERLRQSPLATYIDAADAEAIYELAEGSPYEKPNPRGAFCVWLLLHASNTASNMSQFRQLPSGTSRWDIAAYEAALKRLEATRGTNPGEYARELAWFHSEHHKSRETVYLAALLDAEQALGGPVGTPSIRTAFTEFLQGVALGRSCRALPWLFKGETRFARVPGQTREFLIRADTETLRRFLHSQKRFLEYDQRYAEMSSVTLETLLDRSVPQDLNQHIVAGPPH